MNLFGAKKDIPDIRSSNWNWVFTRFNIADWLYVVKFWESSRYHGWLEQHGRVITKTRGRDFQTLDQDFSFLWNPRKFGKVFQKLGWAFQRLDRMFWNKYLAESFDKRTHYEFLIIWSVKSSLHTSINSPEVDTKHQISAFNFGIFHSI